MEQRAHGGEPGLFRQLLSVLLLPFNVIVVVPSLILWADFPADTRWTFGGPLRLVPWALGLALVFGGMLLLVSTVRLFAAIGRGTLAPWDPTRALVVAGPYGHVRNPMISGVATTLLGIATATGSILVLAWCASFVALNHAYFVLVEEPGLVRRFGTQYEEYRRNVPRWLPRRSPWTPR